VKTRPILPLAGAIDMTLEAAATLPASFRDVSVVDGLVLASDSDRVTASVALTQIPGARRTFEISRSGPTGARTCFRGALMKTDAVTPLSSPDTGAKPKMALDHFYAARTFHGPSLQVVTAVETISQQHIRGRVRANGLTGATPLVSAFDGVLQLFAYWAVQHHGRGGLPLSAARVDVNRIPEPDEVLTCTAVLGAGDDEALTGDADLVDRNGSIVLSLRRSTSPMARPPRLLLVIATG